MDKTFHIDGDFLQEDAPPKPLFNYDFPIDGPSISMLRSAQEDHNEQWNKYEEKIASLARYPLAPGMEWQKTMGIKETDFEVGMCNCAIGQNCPFVAEKWFTTCKVAVPLYRTVAEEGTEKMWLDIVHSVVAGYERMKMPFEVAEELKKQFNITKK